MFSSVTDFDLLQAVEDLAVAFERRGMTRHLELLRRFYLRVRESRARRAGSDDNAWGTEQVIRWLALLRIHPFEHVFELRSPGAPCPRCGGVSAHGAPHSFVQASFPGGFLETCRACGSSWLQNDGDAPSDVG